MERTLKILVLLFVLAVFLPAGNISYLSAGGFSPEPRLVSPMKSEVDLTGKKTLTFSWSSSGSFSASRNYFDFKVFKGRQTYEKNLVFRKRLPANVYSIELDSALFENGQTYTWTLRQSLFGQAPSDDSYNSFTVRK